MITGCNDDPPFELQEDAVANVLHEGHIELVVLQTNELLQYEQPLFESSNC